MEIRRATVEDVSLVAPLYDAYRQFYHRATDLTLARDYLMARLSRGESVIFLATDGGNPGADALGFTQLYPTFCSVAARPYYVLYDLFVAPAARGRGVGRALLERARQHAEETGAFRLELQTAHSNLSAQRLYESQGWKRDEEYYVYTLAIADRG